MKLHPLSEKLVSYLCEKTQNNNPMFFRMLVAYYLGLMPAHMRATISGYGSTNLPINIYALNLSPSGTGKGFSTSFMDRELLVKFQKIFMEFTFPQYANSHIKKIAAERSIHRGTSAHEEEENAKKEFENMGHFMFSFDSATVPAVKQHRQKILLAGSGALNFTIDEVGANLKGQVEVLHAFLELYDLGLIRDKLIKSTVDNKRMARIDGYTPANMLLFGTPSKLLDGSTTNELFFELLEMGYARRCFFGFTDKVEKQITLSARELVENMLNPTNHAFIEQLSSNFALLADINNLNKVIACPENTLIKLMEYKLKCEIEASKLTEHENLKKTELEHRYFKALKLAGVYAFIDNCPAISEENLEYAINLAELSGKNFEKIIVPEKPYMKLAKYLATISHEVTEADMDTDLPCFKGTKAQRQEMLSLAIAWGYRQHIIIKKHTDSGITFYKGESLKETNLEEIQISVSLNMASDYVGKFVPWNTLRDLGSVNDYNWCNHTFVDNHRCEDNVIEGFNLIVLDVDTGFPLKAAIKAFEGTAAMFYTTKRHTDEEPRYRILIPTSHVLYFDKPTYKEFINSIIDTLPFDIDKASNQRSKKWLTNKGEVYFTEGELFDVIPFIPETKKNEDRIEGLNASDLDKLEAWVINNSTTGSRNNQLYNYACVLADAGNDFVTIRNKVIKLNSKLSDSLEESEIESTIMKSIVSKINEHK